MSDAQYGEVRQADFDTSGSTDYVEISGLVVPASGGAQVVGGVLETGTSAVAALAIGGGTPHDSVDSGNPLKIGGYAKTAAPSSVSADGDRVNAWFGLKGNLAVSLVDLTTGAAVATGTQYTEDAAIGAVGTGIGTLLIGRASNQSTGPAAVSADADAVALWASRFGALNVILRDTSGNAVSVGGGTQYVGDAAATATPTGTISMGLANAAAPTDVSANNDAVAAWMLRNGSQVVNIASGGTLLTIGAKTSANSFPVVLASDQATLTVDTELPAAAALSDALGNPTSPMIGSANLLWDSGGSLWVRQREPVSDGVSVVGYAASALVLWNNASTLWDRARTMGQDNVARTGVLAAGLMVENASGNYDQVRAASALATGTTTETGALAVGVGPGWARTRQYTHAASGASTGLSMGGTGVVMFDISSGWVGTITFQGTYDDSVWFTITVTDIASGAAVSTTTGAGRYVTTGLFRQVRTNMTAYTSGTATVNITGQPQSTNAQYLIAGPTGGALDTASPADALAATNTVPMRSFGLLYNGSTFDRERSTQGVTAGASTDIGIAAAGVGPGFARIPAQQTASGTGAMAALNAQGAMTALIDIHGVFTGLTFTIEGTIDGTNWYQLPGQFSAGVLAMGGANPWSTSTPHVSGISASQKGMIHLLGMQKVRCNVSAIASGSFTLDWTLSAAPVGVVTRSIIYGTGGNPFDTVLYADGASSASINLQGTNSFVAAYNGSTVDRLRTSQALTAPGTAIAAQVGILASDAVDADSNQRVSNVSTRDAQVAQRQVIFSDQWSDAVTAQAWTTTNANGGTTAQSSGETVVQTSANANGSSQTTSVTSYPLQPGAVYGFQAWVRVGDTGLALNTRRWGLFTVSGTTPQDGYYFELSGTTFRVVSAKAGAATAVASGSFTRNAISPFVIDTNYHLYEIQVHDDAVYFYIDGIVRHILPGVGLSATRTAVMTLPLTVISINAASAATNALVALRSIALLKFGDPSRTVDNMSWAPNSTSGVQAVGAGPGYDVKTNPAGIVTTSTANAVTINVDGADVITLAVTTIGTTPGSMIIEYSNDDGTTWKTHGSVLLLGTLDTSVQGAFVPAVGDVYMVRTTGLRQIRWRVNAAYASGTSTIKVTRSLGAGYIKGIDVGNPPHAVGVTWVTKTAQYTTTQTGAALWTPASGKRVVVTYVDIGVGGTTAGTFQLWFGATADTTYTRGTDAAIFDHEFAPSATLKPGVIIGDGSGIVGMGAVDQVLRVTDSAAINPITVTVWGYEV